MSLDYSHCPSMSSWNMPQFLESEMMCLLRTLELSPPMRVLRTHQATMTPIHRWLMPPHKFAHAPSTAPCATTRLR